MGNVSSAFSNGRNSKKYNQLIITPTFAIDKCEKIHESVKLLPIIIIQDYYEETNNIERNDIETNDISNNKFIYNEKGIFNIINDERYN